MIRFVLAFLTLAALGAPAPAAEEKPSGKWVHVAEGLEITLQFSDGTLEMTAETGGNGVTASGPFTVEKDGTIKYKIKKVLEKGTFPDPPPVGLEVSFKWKADAKTGKLSDFTAEGFEQAKSIVEGEYTLKK